jgi:DNA-binding protein HU-beta
VATVNKLTVDTFKQVEQVLGETDFVKLFGVPCEEVPGLIDLAAFEAAHVAGTERQGTDLVVVHPDQRISKGNTLTGKHLAAKIATAHNLSKRDSEAILRDVIALLVKNLRSGVNVRLAGLGVLQVRKRSGKMVKRNAATGEITGHKARGKAAVHTVKNKGKQTP